MPQPNRTISFTPEFNRDGEVEDVIMMYGGQPEPFSINEFGRGSPTRVLFEAAWSYFLRESEGCDVDG